ncbi:hypothetical protein, partial [Massilia sp. PWRC2]|uniref:hypothetical protein n=1 Tax=Massilia sp. PWRC2 TaxID=2804626 RepID=UPI003CF989B2
PKSLALSSNAHTYRLLIVKELYSVLILRGAKRCVRCSREGRVCSVSRIPSTSILLPCFCKQPQLLVFVNQFLGEANYSKATVDDARIF